MPLKRNILCGSIAWLLVGGLAAGQEPGGAQPVYPDRNQVPGTFAPGPFPPAPMPGQVPPGGYPQPGMGMQGQGPYSGAQQYQGPAPQGPNPRGAPNFPQRGGAISGSPFGGPDGGTQMPPQRMRDTSLIFIGTPPNKGIREHDIVMVIIDEKSEVTQTSRFDRQRNILFRAQLREFVRIGTSGNLRPAATDQPQIDGQLRSQMNSYGNGRSNEGLKFRIAATVVDVRPNGVLVLEARKTIVTDTGVWVYTMTGACRTQDILANNSIVSENIADMKLSKLEQGKVNDSTDRGWLTALYDFFLPF